MPIKTVNAASYTLTQGDDVRRTLFVEGDSASAQTFLVPRLAKGTLVNIVQFGAGQARLVATGGASLIGPRGSKCAGQGQKMTLIWRSETQVYVSGDVTPTDLPTNPPPGEPPPPVTPPPSAGILQPGVMYWGANGHRDQGGIYTSRTLAQQAADLKNIFGSTPNTVMYRAVGDSQSASAIDADVRALQALDIIPMVTVITYPNWAGFANEAAAYTYGYDTVRAVCLAAPTIQLFDIGNEWNLQVSGAPGGSDGESPSDWTGLWFYPLFRGAMAGAIAAIRDTLPSAQVIGGAGAGWIKVGFVKALADDLRAYNGRNLSWDFTCCHHYDGPGGDNQFGQIDNLNNPAGANPLALMKPATATPKPIIFSEFGASVTGSTDAAAASAITALMDRMVAKKAGSATELGIAGGAIYELYPHGVFSDKYYLCNTDGSLKPQGTAVKNWMAANAGGGGGGGTPSGTWVPIDDASSSITYTGSWWTHSGGFHEGNSSLCEAQFTFTGTGIRYYGKVAPYLTGQLEVYIDNVLQATVSNLRSTEVNNFLLYENTSLSNASHTVRVRLASGNLNSLYQFEYRVP